MSKRITKAEREYYRGMLAALGVVRIHDAETIFHEIVNTIDVEKLVRMATEDDCAKWSGLIQYGYCKRSSLNEVRKEKQKRQQHVTKLLIDGQRSRLKRGYR